MDDVVKFIDSLSTYSHSSILKSYKKLIKYLKDSFTTLTLDDALTIFSKSYDISIIIGTIKKYYKSLLVDADENMKNLFMAYDISKKDKENIPYLKNNSDIDLLKLYVSQLPGPLSEQELIDALTKMINGDEKYIDIIVEHNLRFVVYLAKSCIRDGISIFDLIQEGNIGLINAVKRFDSTQMYKFNKYIATYIRGYMLSYLYNYSRMIKIPNHRCQMFYKIDKTKEILKSKLGDLSDDEVSKFTNISMKDIEEIKKLPTEFVSLDETLKDEEISKTADLISMDKETLEDTIIKKIILSEAFDLLFDDSVLGQRNRKIMLLRFGFMPAHPSFYVRSDVYRKYGTFSLDYKIASDYDIMVRLLHKHRIKTQYIKKDFVTMRTGGISTKNVKNRLLISREDVKACRRNGLYTNIFFISIKYLYKIFEFKIWR